MNEYEPFAISNFRIGLDESQEPWLLPREAFQSVKNAHVYRGVLEKINGYSFYASFSYRSIQGMNRITATQYTVTLTSQPTTSNFFGIGQITEGSTAEIFTYSSDASATLINLVGSAGGTGTVNLTTKLVTLNFANPVPATTYSGVIFIYDRAPVGITSIMGIKPYYAQNGSQQIMVFDEKRAGIITQNFGVLQTTSLAPYGISEIPHQYYQSIVFVGNGGKTYSGVLAKTQFVPGTVNFYVYDNVNLVLVSTISDNGQGKLVGPLLDPAGNNAINYQTGAFNLVFLANLPNTRNVDASVGFFGNIFTGNFTNFISLTNFQFYAFFTNNNDPIYYYDGTMIRYLNTSTSVKLISATSGVPTSFDIKFCLHVLAYRFTLLLIAINVNGVDALNQIQWSVFGDPLDFTNDDFLIASTSQQIRAIGVINNDLIVRFSNSEYIFRYTSDAFAPFRFDSTNNIWRCDASYSAINYDSYITAVGKPGIVQSDGVNIQRIDDRIPDFTDPFRIAEQTPIAYLNQSSIEVSYGERFDDFKEGWLCYNSVQIGSSVPSKSDNVLAYNYQDGTYGIYSFPFSCLGFGSIITVPTWGNTLSQWQNMQDTWGSFTLQANSLVDLGGDHFDQVWELNDGSELTTVAGDEADVLIDVITKNFNPYIEQGQQARLGYVDFLVSSDADTLVRVQFYINDELYLDANQTPQGYYQETVLNFAPSTPNNTPNQTKIWKRIYVGALGKTHTLRIYQNAADLEEENDQPVRIHAIVLYFKPAGRIFN